MQHPYPRKIVSCLMIGAVLTVLSSWWCRAFERYGWIVPIGSRPGKPLPVTSWPVPVPSDWNQSPGVAVRWRGFPITVTYYQSRQIWTNAPQTPSTSMFGDAMEPWTSSTSMITCEVTSEETGWPWPALARYTDKTSYTFAPTPLQLDWLRSGVELPPVMRSPWIGTDSPLPLLPLWPGFLANTLFYASVPWLLMFGVATLIRRRRIRRGLCIQCAYPISGLSVCPECGTTGASVGSNSGQVVHVVTEP